MKTNFFTTLILVSQITGLSGNDLTVDNLTINASATISGGATFKDATSFGTLYTGLQSSPIASGRAFTVSVSQGYQEVQVPYTVDGYYQDGYITVDDYGMINSGRWEAQYTYGVVSGQSYGPYYDSEGNITTPEYNDYQYGYTYTGEAWIDESYWGIIGSHSEPGQVWVPPTESTYTDWLFGVPKIQFTAARSDVNWAWQVPNGLGGTRDIMLLWDGGLRLPSQDNNRMMALMPDSLTQSYTQTWDGSTQRTDSSEVRANEVKKMSHVRYDSGLGEISQIDTATLKSNALSFNAEEQMSGASSTVQTQISARSASFGGTVQVAGDVGVHGVIRVYPAGNLGMGPYTDGPMP